MTLDDDGWLGDKVHRVCCPVRVADTIEAAHSGEGQLLAVFSFPAGVLLIDPAADANPLLAAVICLQIVLLPDQLQVLRAV